MSDESTPIPNPDSSSSPDSPPPVDSSSSPAEAPSPGASEAGPATASDSRDRSVVSRWCEIVVVFFRIGVIGFGGPAAHIALLEDEVVTRRKWVSREKFLDLVGLTNIIPGPNSTEMAIHLGLLRGGAVGLVLAGVGFILPAVVITGILAWVYAEYGQLPAVEPFLRGIQPAVLAIIGVAVYRLAKPAITTWRRAAIAAAVALAALFGVDEAVAIIVGGVLGALILIRIRPSGATTAGAALLAMTSIPGRALAQSTAATASSAAAAAGVSLTSLGGFFLKVGFTLYGGGYVLVAFLRAELVEHGGILPLSSGELLDAIAIGQFTPGPILSTATFVGYLASGVPGALVATVGIFLPSFICVVLLHAMLHRVKDSPWKSAFLDAVKAGAVGLMVVAMWTLARGSLIDVPSWVITLTAGFVYAKYRVAPAWLVGGGALAGWLVSLVV